MLITEDSPQATYIIRSYSTSSVTVNESTYRSSFIISNEELLFPWRPQSISELTIDDLQLILDLKSELVLLGTGTNFKMPDAHLLELFHQRDLGFECMDTQAACRTYSALTAEGRHVTAALIIEPTTHE
jgi:uncharacterized protein